MKVFSSLLLTVPLVGAYSMYALGIVFIYRGSRVLNLAHGAMAMFPAYICYALAPSIGVYAAFVVAVLAGAALGGGVERFVVRRLRSSGPTAQTVGTVAILGLLIAIAARVWGTTNVQAPKVFPDKHFTVGNAQLQLGSIGLFFVALIVSAGFIALFRYTDLGLALRAAANNRRAAALMGIDPNRTTAIAWCFAGALAGLGGVLLAATTNPTPYTASFGVIPAYVAALLGGLESVSGAVVGSIFVGVVIGIVPTLPKIGSITGIQQFVLLIVALGVMATRGHRFTSSDLRSGL
ncbi:MAG: branched-chain amino acid ABC transporter permease [Actinomycetota bacterium]